MCFNNRASLIIPLLFNIDNLIIEIDNNEIPILDGSSRLFFEAISNEV